MSVARFLELEGVIEKSEAAAEDAKWEQAQVAYEDTQRKSLRQYASEVDRSHTHIRYLTAVWTRWGLETQVSRPKFADAYATVKAGSEEIVNKADSSRLERERQVPTRHEDKVEMARTLMSDPEVTKAVVTGASPARGKIHQEVSKVNSQASQRRAQEREEKAIRNGKTMSDIEISYERRLIDMVAEMSSMIPFLDEASDRAKAAYYKQFCRMEEVLDRSKNTVAPDLDVIEGNVSGLRELNSPPLGE